MRHLARRRRHSPSLARSGVARLARHPHCWHWDAAPPRSPVTRGITPRYSPRGTQGGAGWLAAGVVSSPSAVTLRELWPRPQPSLLRFSFTPRLPRVTGRSRRRTHAVGFRPYAPRREGWSRRLSPRWTIGNNSDFTMPCGDSRESRQRNPGSAAKALRVDFGVLAQAPSACTIKHNP